MVGLTLYGFNIFIISLISLIVAGFLFIKGGINILFGILLIIFGTLPNIGIGLWLWDEATSHGNR